MEVLFEIPGQTTVFFTGTRKFHHLVMLISVLDLKSSPSVNLPSSLVSTRIAIILVLLDPQ